jgi:flagellar biosynthetic protein FliP
MTPATLRRHRWAVRARSFAIAGALAFAAALVFAGPAAAVVGPMVVNPIDPSAPATPIGPTAVPVAGITVGINGIDGTPSSSIIVLVAITLLSVAPSLLLMTTSFTKVFVVLVLTRNALGLQGTPPTQVLAGLSLFLSLFIMGPVLGQMNDQGIQPYIHGEMTFGQGLDAAVVPLKGFMLEHTRESDIALMTRAAETPNPNTKADVSMTTLMPAFMLSELRSAFIIGFVIFVPFLVIDLVVSGALMSMGMMMLPPVMVSLPFKLLLFVLVDGWTLVITALIGSYH